MKFIDNLGIRGKVLVPTISLIVITLVVGGVLVWTLRTTSATYARNLICRASRSRSYW